MSDFRIRWLKALKLLLWCVLGVLWTSLPFEAISRFKIGFLNFGAKFKFCQIFTKIADISPLSSKNLSSLRCKNAFVDIWNTEPTKCHRNLGDIGKMPIFMFNRRYLSQRAIFSHRAIFWKISDIFAKGWFLGEKELFVAMFHSNDDFLHVVYVLNFETTLM